MVENDFGKKVKQYTFFACGQCYQCKQQKLTDWTTRIMIERTKCKHAYFTTLTYDEENVYKKNDCYLSLSKKDLQNFIREVRREKKIRYYAIGEYGTKTFRPHYHIIIFTNEKMNVDFIKKHWKRGNIKNYPLCMGNIVYVCKFHVNYKTINDEHCEIYGIEKQFAIMSRRPGIGFSYIDEKIKEYHDENYKRNYLFVEGVKRPIPRVFQKKLLNVHQLDYLYCKRLEKEQKKFDDDPFYYRHEFEKHQINDFQQKLKSKKDKL